jgi:hydrogenase/urease accessory protein HupE
MVATALLHIAGIAACIGARGAMAFRICGGAAALAGVAILSGAL